jgi:predicted acylesterase/phospholipase RssA
MSIQKKISEGYNIRVVISGGGTKYPALMGAVNSLSVYVGSDNIKSVHGTSAGALAALLLAKSKDPSHFEYLFREIVAKNPPNTLFSNPYTWLTAIRLLMSESVFRNNSIGSLIDKLFEDPVLYKDLQLNVYNQTRGNLYTHSASKSKTPNKEEIKQFVLASMAIPTIFPPVVIKGESYIDGGIIENIPYIYDLSDREIITFVVYLDKVKSVDTKKKSTVATLSDAAGRLIDSTSINSIKAYSRKSNTYLIPLFIGGESFNFTMDLKTVMSMYDQGFYQALLGIHKLNKIIEKK